MLPRLNPRFRVLTVICVLVTSIVIILHRTEDRYGRAEEVGRDWLTTNGSTRLSAQNPRLLFLGIDDASKNLDTLFSSDLEKSRTLQLMKQEFPWNREVYAHVVNRLVEAGASEVIFDMLFPVPRGGDELFRETLEKHRDRVVIGSNLRDGIEDADNAQMTINRKPAMILPSSTLLPSENSTDPLLGFVNVKVDEDQTVRRFTYRTSLLEFFNIPPQDNAPELLSLPAQALVKIGLGHLVPSDHKPRRLRFSEEIRPRSLHEIFVEPQWEAPPYNGGSLFKDKIVLIGAAGNEAEDRLRTPSGTVLAPSIHLSALNAALNKDFVEETGPLANHLLIVGGGLLAWIFGLFIRRPMLRFALIVASVACSVFIAQWIYNDFGILPIVVGPALALSVSGFTWVVWEHVLDRIERQRTRRALERYIGQDVAKGVLDENAATYLNSLGGVRKPIAILFSDIRGFTTLTESADPHALVSQLNEYFGEMVAIVFAHHGTLDKFIGDAVMAHWGSISSLGPAQDAAHAVAAALEMRPALERLNASWKQRGIKEWKIGIGVNHGEPITGNIGAAGAHERFDFTIVGDAVNFASRLEGATKEYHLDLCIGENVADLVRNQFLIRSVDLIIVKGKTRPVAIFTVLGKIDMPAPSWLVHHEAAVRFYRAGAFVDAAESWRKVLAEVPEDGLTEVFLARCADLMKNPPQEKWTGVYEMTSK